MLPTPIHALPQQGDCFSNIAQDFLICTTIHKARQLGVFQGEIYVRVTLDNRMIRHTKVFANSENPYFNEYFVFEIKCTLGELLRLTILYEVKRRTSCKRNPTLGQLLIDMQSVWHQRNRCYFKKWGRLEASIEHPHQQQQQVATFTGDFNNESRGFLQIDLAIVSQATNTQTLLRAFEDADMVTMATNVWQLNPDYDDIEKNLLDNIDADIRCNIRYTLIFYRGIMTKKADYFIQFRFHPFKGRTSVVRNTQYPVWNQEIHFAWVYPALAQTLLIQLMTQEHLQWKCVAEYEVHFEEISFRDRPALGPTFIHFYDSLNPGKYIGRLLLEIHSECLEAQPKRHLNIKSIQPLDETRYWQEETFVAEFLVLQGDFVHANASNCKIQMKLAEHTSNNLECFLKPYHYKKSQSITKPLKYFRQESPYKAITLRLRLPDYRHKCESERFLREVQDYMTMELENFRQFQMLYATQYQGQVKVLRDIINRVMDKIKESLESHRLEYQGPKEPTQWDVKRLLYLQDYFLKFLDELKNTRSRLRPASESHDIEEISQNLMKSINRLQQLLVLNALQDEWPDLILVFCASSKECGFCRLRAKTFIFPGSGREESPSDQSWKVRNFVFKDMQCQHTCNNCGCTVAIIQGCLSIVNEVERFNLSKKLQNEWLSPEDHYWRPTVPYTAFKCRIFIHQAKVRPGSDRNGLCDPYVRVMICSNAAETPVLYATLSPIWNAVISIDYVKIPGSIHWYGGNCAPIVAIELYDTDKNTADDYLGLGMLPVAVIPAQKYDTEGEGHYGEFGVLKNKHALDKFQALGSLSPPPLKWIPISISGATRAEILMSAELVELSQESDIDQVTKDEPLVIVGIPTAIRPTMKNYVLEVVFAGLRNYTKSSAYSGRHRVKVRMADLLLTSGLSSSQLRSSINFLILYASGVVSLPEQLEYWPAIIATDVAVSSKDQETTLGAVLIGNSRRYLQSYKEVKCAEFRADEDSDVETNITITTLNITADETLETSPLLKKKPTEGSIWNRFSRRFFKTPSGLITNIDDPFGLNEVLDEKEFTWWTKFYNSGIVASSNSISRFKHKLSIYQNELEKQPEFSHLHDWAEPLQLVHGVRYKRNSLPKEEVYATLKMNIKITACQCGRSETVDASMLRPLATALNPRYQAELHALADLVKLVVRVYVVQGLQLRPREKHAQADSYVRIQLGQKHVTNRAEYVANESSPVFGKCFQIDGLLPREHILEISVFNRHTLRDDPIGSTHIDLEDRWRSKHRATVGIANEFSSIGYNKWRDSQSPKQILQDLCRKYDVRLPKFKGPIIEVDGVILEDETEIATGEDLQERLSLTALRHLKDLPSFGYKLVPEHVETRSLYRPECPGIEQGKIQLWLELFDANLSVPPVIDITPQPPQLYELRIVIFGVSEVILDERNIFGNAMSDIYVKGWCSNPDEAQTTDIHYRSMDGEGKFNWRMIFPLKYSSVEDMMLVKRKTGLLEEYQMKQPPKLSLQIWDDDIISQDDFLGSLEINLSSFPQPFVTAKKCQLLPHDNLLDILATQGPQLKKRSSSSSSAAASLKLLNIFRQKKVRGWFPVRGNIPEMGNKPGLAGKIELELEVLTEKEAATYPVGLGRNPPNALPEPNRPETSFNPLISPWKGFKHIVAPNLMKYLLIVGLLVLLGFSIFLIVMNFPVILEKWTLAV